MKKVDVVVVGAGPAGIGAAVEAALAGKEVALLEKGAEICKLCACFTRTAKG